MSDALHFSAEQAINPYYTTSQVNKSLALSEHRAIRLALEAAGVEVKTTQSPSESQDGVYTANWALVRGDTAVLARLPSVRQAEEAWAEAALRSLGKKIVHVPDSLRFSGQGDALPCGDLLFCGQGYRSDPEAQQFAAEALGYRRIQLQTIPALDEHAKPIINSVSGWADSLFYDIDLALAVIRHPSGTQKGLIAYCPEAFTHESQQILATLQDVETITVSYDEASKAFATNLVSTGETVIMSANAPGLQASLEARGISVVCPQVSELAKGGGYIRCTTLTID